LTVAEKDQNSWLAVRFYIGVEHDGIQSQSADGTRTGADNIVRLSRVGVPYGKAKIS
tara:strand:+ start:201 stop:371 length:171 start_codon:yes stop_codon:yes gene_type:complete